MNRRDLLKTALCIPFASQLQASVIQPATAPEIVLGNGIEKIFQLVPSELENLELPIDLLSPGTESELTTYTVSENTKIPERERPIDWLSVPIRLTDIENINHNAWHTILAAGVDFSKRRVSSRISTGEIRPSLIYNMRRKFNKNQKSKYFKFQLTDIFVDYTVPVLDKTEEVAKTLNINIHKVNLNQYIEFYTKSVEGKFKYGKSSLVIGISPSDDNFLIPTYNGKYGVCVLDGSKIIIGQV